MLSKCAPLTRKEKSFFGLTLVLCVGVAVFGYLSATPEVNIQSPKPLPQQNAHSFYITAQNSYVRVPIAPLFDDYAAQRTNSQKAWLYSLSRRQAWLKANANMGVAIQRGQSLPYRLPLKSWEDYYSEKIFLRGWSFCSYKIIESKTYLEEGKTGKAMDCTLDMVEIAGQITSGGLYRGRDEEEKILGIVTRLLPQISEKASLRELQTALHRLNGLLGKRESYEQYLKDWRNRDLYCILKSMAGPPHDSKYRANSGDYKDWRQFYLSGRYEYDNVAIKTALHTLSKRAYIDAVEKAFKTAAIENREPFNGNYGEPDKWYIDALKIRLDASRIHEAETLVQRRFLLLSLALQIFKKQYGTFPQTLAELSPKILTSLPNDPFSLRNSTFQFKKSGNTYALYSIGRNSFDNKGIKEYGGFGTDPVHEITDKDDIVFDQKSGLQPLISIGTKPQKPSGKAPLFSIPFKSSPDLPVWPPLP